MVGALTLSIVGPSKEQVEAAASSFLSVAEVLASAERLSDRLNDFAANLLSDAFSDCLAEAKFEGRKLVNVEAKARPSDDADTIVAFVEPGNGMLRLVCAIADEFSGRVHVEFRDGWPILSHDRPAAGTEGGGAVTHLAPGGAA